MISVIIPIYNGSSILRNQLPRFVEYLLGKKYEYEIIIVDDGSIDHKITEQIAAEFGCTFLQNPVNLGKGAAVRKGMLKAKGKFRFYTDVDIPFNYNAFDNFLQYLDEKEFDIVIGDRTLPQSSYFTEIPASRKIGSAIFSFLVGRFITTGLFDTQCGLKGLKADVAMDLFSVSGINGFAFDVELLYVALKRNYDIKRLPVTLRCQEGSTVSVLKHGSGMFKDLLAIKLNHIMGKYKKS